MVARQTVAAPAPTTAPAAGVDLTVLWAAPKLLLTVPASPMA
ncbi:MAG: hypothetical protein ABSF26_13725 [Thermoguttaceae bacterium]